MLRVDLAAGKYVPPVLMDQLLTLSVEYNGVFIPGRQIERLISRFGICLSALTGVDECPVSLPGSATLIRHGGRYFLVCTRHQLKNVGRLENVCIMIPDGGRTRCITSGGGRWYEGVYDGEHHEIAVFDFSDPCADLPEMRRMFFDFRTQHPDVEASKVVALVAYGFPTAFTDYDYEHGRVNVHRRPVLCRFVGGDCDEAVHALAPTTPLDFDPDGMSGGPVFCILEEHAGFSLHLAGITVTGGRDRLRVIKAGAIERVLRGALERH